jgi:sec-independent protein translocase protein TatA
MLLANFLSPWELIIVLVVVVLLFGNRMPSVMRNLGKGVTEFKKGVAGIEDEEDASARKSEPAPKAPEQKPA